MNRDIVEQYEKLYEKDLFDTILPFWSEYGLDRKKGGIHTCLTKEGKVFSAEKSVWMQGRGGWLFAYVCNMFGVNEKYRKMAQSAIEFTKRHCIDAKDGRLFFTVSADGDPIRKRRYVFSEYFYIMANAEYYGLSHNRVYLEEARRYHGLVVDIWKDPVKDPFKITPKFESTAPQMRGLCGELVLMLVTRTLRVHDPEKADYYKDLERTLIEHILNYQYNSKFGVLLENTGLDGSYMGDISEGRIINPGHCLECAWYLLREAEELNDRSFISRAEEIYAGAFRYGWDKEYGGLLYFVDAEGFPPQAYEHDMKLWWVHTEALVAALKLYRVTGKEKYWEDFAMLTDYAFLHFRDAECGEWYGYLHRDGTPTLPVCKGNLFKGPFHVPRMYSEVVLELEKIIGQQAKNEER